MTTPNNLAAERWYLPPQVPPVGVYWLTVDNNWTGRRLVIREPYDANGWPQWLSQPRFKIIAFMRADAPEPYQF